MQFFFYLVIVINAPRNSAWLWFFFLPQFLFFFWKLINFDNNNIKTSSLTLSV